MVLNDPELTEKDNPQNAQNEEHYPEHTNDTNDNEKPEVGTDNYLDTEVGL